MGELDAREAVARTLDQGMADGGAGAAAAIGTSRSVDGERRGRGVVAIARRPEASPWGLNRATARFGVDAVTGRVEVDSLRLGRATGCHGQPTMALLRLFVY